MDQASLKLLAISGALDEGESIDRPIMTAGSQGGLVADGVLQKSVLFVVYQPGRHGRVLSCAGA